MSDDSGPHASMRQLPLAVRLHDHATFETFHAADNQALVNCLRAVAEGDPAPPAVFLSGRPGSGKSHLLQSMCALADARSRRSAFLRVPELLHTAAGPDVLGGWSGVKLVCLDGIDAVIGDRAWELAVMRLYNLLDGVGATLVAAAAEPVADQAFALADLRSRLAAGFQLRLAALDDEQASNALALRARARGMELPAETARWLLRRFRRDMHSLCALLDSLDEASLAEHRRLTVPFVRERLGL